MKKKRFPPKERRDSSFDSIGIFNRFYGPVLYQPEKQIRNQACLKANDKDHPHNVHHNKQHKL